MAKNRGNPRFSPKNKCVLNDSKWPETQFLAPTRNSHTPALSYDQDFKKGRNKRSMDSGPILHTDTGKYCQNLKTLGKSNF